jgi:flagellar biosynthesis/type III secretory pathway protein FliH
MINRDALAREMHEAAWPGLYSDAEWAVLCDADTASVAEAFAEADIALRHIAQARAEGYEAGLKAGFYEGVQAAHENIGLPQEPPA